MDYATASARVLLGGLLFVAGLLKIRHGTSDVQLARALEALGLRRLDFGLSRLVAVEVVLGVWLVSGKSPALVAVVAAALFTAFAIATAVLVARGYAEGCACFGSASETRLGPVQVARNLVFMTLAAIVAERSYNGACGALTLTDLPLVVLALAIAAAASFGAVYALAAAAQDFLFAARKSAR